MHKQIDDNTPILIGSGQTVLREIDSPAAAKSAIDLASTALSSALDDTGCNDIRDAVDVLVMTRALIDSARTLKHPFGASKKPPLSLANQAGIKPARLVYGEEGGQSPQRLVNEFAEAIFGRECEVVALCGAEATAAMRTAQRNDWSLDWADDPEGEIEDRGFNRLMSDVELKHHIIFPPQVYALFENAWRTKHQLSVAEHRLLMGRLFAPFSDIAARNPYAQFPKKRSAEFLATASDKNYAVNEPYYKWMVAQDAVNQAAAVILTSVGKARQLGISEDRWVFLHGYADANDHFVSERTDLSTSIAMKAAFNCALDMAQKHIDDIALLDLYSCFPIAVIAACEALEINWNDPRDLTVTGGLPFFGGPGNSYSLHAIAEMYKCLRDAPGQFGMVGANGGYLSKQSVGVYSTSPVAGWRPQAGNPAQAIVDQRPPEKVLYPFEGEAVVESYSLVYKKSAPIVGFVICREKSSNQRVLAKVAKDDSETLNSLVQPEPIGRLVKINTTDEGSLFTFL